MKPPFIIYGLPRSRTFWLSRFLSYDDWHCGHEEIRHCRSLDDVKFWFRQGNAGTVETAGAPFWRLARDICPEANVVVIRRPVEDAVESLKRLLINFDEADLHARMRYLDGKLAQIAARVPGALVVPFADLATEAACAAIFEHCLPYRHDPAWWRFVAPQNLQINLRAVLRYYEAHRPGIERLRLTARQTMLSALSAKPVAADGMTFQQESFDQSFADASALLAEHCVAVGEAPDNFQAKNIPLMRALDAAGALQVTTARSNGRMFGYLMAVLAPSLESREIMTGVHTAFYVSPAAPGIGLKLQRASIEGLRRRGVRRVQLEAGARGSGPRLGALYRRMGAVQSGEAYTLNLGAA